MRPAHPHPGKTVTERLVLDAIGTGKPVPKMTEALEARMVKAGKIVRTGTTLFMRDRFGEVWIPTFEMTPATHLEWTDHWCEIAAEDEAAS